MKNLNFKSIGFLFFALIVSVNSMAQYSGGDGTLGNPYQIATANDLVSLSKNSSDWGSYFIQMADIIFNADETKFDWDGDGDAIWDTEDQLGFSPIGNATTEFGGSYNGQEHTIKNFFINRPSASDKLGFIGVLAATGEISNLGFINASVTSTYTVGILVGLNYGSINSCFTTGEVSGSSNQISGFVGNNALNATITNCYSTATTHGSSVVAGFVAYNSGTITSSMSVGIVTAQTTDFVGGFVGYNDGTVTDCFWDYQVSGQTAGSGTPKTTAEMQSEATFPSPAWDFITSPIWKIDQTHNNYPYLAWEKSPMPTPGNALRFDGTDEYGIINGSSEITGNFTIELWFKTDFTGSGSIISSRMPSLDYSFDINLVDGNLVHGDIGNGSSWLTTSADANFNFSDEKWHHLAYVVTTSGYTIYMDGNQIGTGSYSGTPILRNANYDIYYTQHSSPRFNGDIDEVRIWSSELTQEEIRANMYNELEGTEANLEIYHRFDYTSGSIITDITGSGNDAILYNMEDTDWVESYAMVAPISAAATAVTSSGFVANWTAPSVGTVSGYYLDVATDEAFANRVLTKQDVTGATSYTVAGLNPETTYYYRVRANKTSVEGQGTSHYSTINKFATTSLQPQYPGNSLSFNGVNELIEVQGTETIQAPFTIEVWAKVDNLSQTNTFISSRAPSEFGFDAKFYQGKIHADIGNGTSWLTTTADAALDYKANQWYHIVYVVENGSYKIYVNGEEKASQAIPAGTALLRDANHQIKISAPENFGGNLDEFRIWNDARTPTEIQDNMYKRLNGDEAGLVIYYDFDQASGINLPDLASVGGFSSGTLTEMNTENWSKSTIPINVLSANIQMPSEALVVGGEYKVKLTNNFLSENQFIPDSIVWILNGIRVAKGNSELMLKFTKSGSNTLKAVVYKREQIQNALQTETTFNCSDPVVINLTDQQADYGSNATFNYSITNLPTYASPVVYSVKNSSINFNTINNTTLSGVMSEVGVSNPTLEIHSPSGVLIASKDFKLTVNPDLTYNISESTIRTKENIIFNGITSVADSKIKSWNWEISGPWGTQTFTVKQPLLKFTQEGNYSGTLTMRMYDGLVATESIAFSVVPNTPLGIRLASNANKEFKLNKENILQFEVANNSGLISYTLLDKPDNSMTIDVYGILRWRPTSVGNFTAKVRASTTSTYEDDEMTVNLTVVEDAINMKFKVVDKSAAAMADVALKIYEIDNGTTLKYQLTTDENGIALNSINESSFKYKVNTKYRVEMNTFGAQTTKEYTFTSANAGDYNLVFDNALVVREHVFKADNITNYGNGTYTLSGNVILNNNIKLDGTVSLYDVNLEEKPARMYVSSNIEVINPQRFLSTNTYQKKYYLVKGLLVAAANRNYFFKLDDLGSLTMYGVALSFAENRDDNSANDTINVVAFPDLPWILDEPMKSYAVDYAEMALKGIESEQTLSVLKNAGFAAFDKQIKFKFAFPSIDISSTYVDGKVGWDWSMEGLSFGTDALKLEDLSIAYSSSTRIFFGRLRS